MAEFFRVQQVESVHVIELSLPDQIDPMEFDRLNESILAELERRVGGGWVIDCTGITYMGSAMLGLLVNLRYRIKKSGGKLALCGLSGRLAEIFRASSMERLFTIARGRAEALRLTSAR